MKCLVKEMSSWSKLLRQNNFSKLKLDFNPFSAASISQNKKTNTKKKCSKRKKVVRNTRSWQKKKLVESSKPLASTVLELFNFPATGGGGGGVLGFKSFPGFEEG